MNVTDELVFSLILDREAELSVLAAAGFPVQDELALVHALLRLIRSGHGQIAIELPRGPEGARLQ